MRRLSITGYELPRFDVGDIANGPHILCSLDSQECINHDGSVGVEIRCRNVRRIGDQTKRRDIHVRGYFVSARKSQFFATIRQLRRTYDLCSQLDIHLQIFKSLQCILRYARRAFLEDCWTTCNLRSVNRYQYFSAS